MRKFISVLVMLALLLGAIVVPTTASMEKMLLGDLNSDLDINASDALIALQHSVQLTELTGDSLITGDVNADNRVDSADALLILQYSVKLISIFPVREENSMEKIWVDPVGLEKGNLYVISAKALVGSDGRSHDLTRLAVCIQGLVNRNFDTHGVAVALNLDSTDPFWLKYMCQEGRTYAGMNEVRLSTTADVLDTFAPFLKAYGIIEWDPEVPSTANVASTICALERPVPVRYSEEEGTLYQILTKEYNIPVKQSLVGKFRNAALGQKIADTNIDSSGSAKCDAYLWAIENYLPYCNIELLAYTVDGAPAVPTNPLYTWPDATSANTCGLPNQDYFISKQCFFFDLTSYGLEAPSDDPGQPLGADKETLHKLLKKRYDLAGGTFGTVIGFPPWHIKYTTHCNTANAQYALDPPRLEWQFVETTTSYNCGIEADAAHPCWMSNGSLYTNYECVVEPTPNAPAKNISFDSNVFYYTLPYAGDYDCSPWLKARAREVWSDSAHGEIPYTFSFNVNLADRIPMIMDFMYENRTDNDYIIAAEGMTYINQSALVQGFVGKEADPITRTLPTGIDQYLKYAKPYFERFHIDVTTRIINGFTALEPAAMDAIGPLTPSGNFLQNSTAGAYDLQVYQGTPYLRMLGISGDTDAARCESMFQTQMRQMFSNGYNFCAFEFCNPGTNYTTPSGIKHMVETYDQYIKENHPDCTVQYVDVNTFLALVRQSGQGVIRDAQ